MNEPQVWTLIGVFSAAIFGVVGVVSTMFVQILRSEIGGLRTEMSLRLEAIEATFERRFDHLDRDVQAIAKVVFPES